MKYPFIPQDHPIRNGKDSAIEIWIVEDGKEKPIYALQCVSCTEIVVCDKDKAHSVRNTRGLRRPVCAKCFPIWNATLNGENPVPFNGEAYYSSERIMQTLNPYP